METATITGFIFIGTPIYTENIDVGRILMKLSEEDVIIYKLSGERIIFETCDDFIINIPTLIKCKSIRHDRKDTAGLSLAFIQPGFQFSINGHTFDKYMCLRYNTILYGE